MREKRNIRLKRFPAVYMFFLLLVLAVSLGVTGCQPSNNTGESDAIAEKEGTPDVLQAEGETKETEPGEEPESAESESTEPETESPYNEDGTRRAWVQVEGRLNVRKKAKSTAEFIGSFPSRQEIKVLDEKPVKGFYKVSGIDYTTEKEITGYASKDYITFDAPEDPEVELDVVSYLQTDERWGDVLLGSTRKTMYDIGCATTSLAMCESFLKGKEIFPNELAENAIYTSNGEIGWPKDYYWNYNKDMYLDFVYNKLHEGIPVLIGCTRRNGRPHWVLITGYTGDGGTLKAKDFLINDPLPYGRTNLKQYLDEYPVFNKLIYYCGDRALVEGSEESKAAAESKKEAKQKAKQKKNKKNKAEETQK